MIAPILTVLFLVSGIFQWSALNCWHDEVDINTGRYRRTRFLLYRQIGERTEETWLSHSVRNPNTSPDWRRVNTFSPGIRYSPHHQFHGAIHQIKTLELAHNIIPFEPEARRKVANTVLTLWENNGSYSGADDFVEKVAQTASELHDKGGAIFTASDVPAD